MRWWTSTCFLSSRCQDNSERAGLRDLSWLASQLAYELARHWTSPLLSDSLSTRPSLLLVADLDGWHPHCPYPLASGWGCSMSRTGRWGWDISCPGILFVGSPVLTHWHISCQVALSSQFPLSLSGNFSYSLPFQPWILHSIVVSRILPMLFINNPFLKFSNSSVSRCLCFLLEPKVVKQPCPWFAHFYLFHMRWL